MVGIMISANRLKTTGRAMTALFVCFCFISILSPTAFSRQPDGSSPSGRVTDGTESCSAGLKPLLQGDGNPPFLYLNSAGGHEAARALIEHFFSESAFPGRESGYPHLGELDSIVFEQDGQTHRLEKWPGLSLVYRNNQLLLQSGQTETLLTEIAPINFTDDWPLAVVEVGDIDFDGQPDFFVLTVPAGSGSFGYQLLNWDRKNAHGLSLFVPFSESKLPPSPDKYTSRLFFKDGRLPNPYFDPARKRLAFIRKNGPYYDTESWCYADSRYYLCEITTQSYYAHADNMYEIGRRVGLNAKGEIEDTVCFALNDPEPGRRLKYAAGLPVPLYSKPGDDRSQSGVLQPGAVVNVLDYKMIDDSGPPALWYKVEPVLNPGKTAWCCVHLKNPIVGDDGWVHMDNAEAGRYQVRGVRRTAVGAELLLFNGETEIVLPNIPFMTPVVPLNFE